MDESIASPTCVPCIHNVLKTIVGTDQTQYLKMYSGYMSRLQIFQLRVVVTRASNESPWVTTQYIAASARPAAIYDAPSKQWTYDLLPSVLTHQSSVTGIRWPQTRPWKYYVIILGWRNPFEFSSIRDLSLFAQQYILQPLALLSMNLLTHNYLIEESRKQMMTRCGCFLFTAIATHLSVRGTGNER